MSTEDLYGRLARLDAKVEHLYRHLGIPLPEPAVSASPQVHQLVREGNMLAAVQLHRTETGLGLSEARSEVESLRP